MAIPWMDFPSGNQGIYGTDRTLMLNGFYAEVGGFLVEDPDPNVTGVVFREESGTSPHVSFRRLLASSPQTTAGFALRVWMSNLPPTIQTFAFILRGNTSADQVCLTVNTIGQVQVRTGGASGPIAAETPAPVLIANAWQHLEVKFVQGVSTGEVELRVEGVTKLTASGINTGSLPYQQIVSYQPTNVIHGFIWYIKDLIPWDGSGGWGDDFVGSQQVYYGAPNSDVSSGWSRTTGTTDFAILDAQPPNDAQYIFAGQSPIPAPSITTFADLPPEVTSIKAVMSVVRTRKSDGGDASLQLSLLSAAAAANGVNRPITTAFTYYADVFHLDPNTGAPWTPPGLDAARLQINRTV